MFEGWTALRWMAMLVAASGLVAYIWLLWAWMWNDQLAETSAANEA